MTEQLPQSDWKTADAFAEGRQNREQGDEVAIDVNRTVPIEAETRDSELSESERELTRQALKGASDVLVDTTTPTPWERNRNITPKERGLYEDLHIQEPAKSTPQSRSIGGLPKGGLR